MHGSWSRPRNLPLTSLGASPHASHAVPYYRHTGGTLKESSSYWFMLLLLLLLPLLRLLLLLRNMLRDSSSIKRPHTHTHTHTSYPPLRETSTKRATRYSVATVRCGTISHRCDAPCPFFFSFTEPLVRDTISIAHVFHGDLAYLLSEGGGKSACGMGFLFRKDSWHRSNGYFPVHSTAIHVSKIMVPFLGCAHILRGWWVLNLILVPSPCSGFPTSVYR